MKPGKEEKCKGEYWATHIEQWRNSGLSQKRYCDSKGISFWSFRTWIGKTKQEGFIKIRPGNIENGTHLYTGKIKIIIRNDIHIEFEENASEEFIQKLFRILLEVRS